MTLLPESVTHRTFSERKYHLEASPHSSRIEGTAVSGWLKSPNAGLFKFFDVRLFQDRFTRTVLSLGITDSKSGTFSDFQQTVIMTEAVLPAWHAARLNKLDELQGLVPDEIAPNAKIISARNHCHTLLMVACAHGAVECVEYLLNNGADPNIKNFHGFAALHWAAFTGRTEVVDILLDSKADIEIRTMDGKTPLHVAAFRGNGPFVKQLLGRGADINAVSSEGLTALHWAATANQRAIAKLLIERGIVTDEVDEQKRTVVEFARERNIEWLATLLEPKPAC
jgi:ankyrin repeat protein